MSHLIEKPAPPTKRRNTPSLLKVSAGMSPAPTQDSASDVTEQDKLDAALDLTFPASDPVSIRCTSA